MDLQRGQVPMGLALSLSPGLSFFTLQRAVMAPVLTGPWRRDKRLSLSSAGRESARRRVRNNQHQAVGRLLPACELPAVTKTRENSSQKCHTHLPPLQEKNEPLAQGKAVCEPNEEATVYLWPEARLPLEWMSLVTVLSPGPISVN